jgi:hypothetical protein
MKAALFSRDGAKLAWVLHGTPVAFRLQTVKAWSITFSKASSG